MQPKNKTPYVVAYFGYRNDLFLNFSEIDNPLLDRICEKVEEILKSRYYESFRDALEELDGMVIGYTVKKSYFRKMLIWDNERDVLTVDGESGVECYANDDEIVITQNFILNRYQYETHKIYIKRDNLEERLFRMYKELTAALKHQRYKISLNLANNTTDISWTVTKFNLKNNSVISREKANIIIEYIVYSLSDTDHNLFYTPVAIYETENSYTIYNDDFWWDIKDDGTVSIKVQRIYVDNSTYRSVETLTLSVADD